MEEVWKKLPNDLIRHILCFCDIDTRRAFGLKPQRNRLPIFDLKIKPLIWAEYWIEKFHEVILYCKITTNYKYLTGKLIISTNVHHVMWDDHSLQIVDRV